MFTPHVLPTAFPSVIITLEHLIKLLEDAQHYAWHFIYIIFNPPKILQESFVVFSIAGGKTDAQEHGCTMATKLGEDLVFV